MLKGLCPTYFESLDDWLEEKGVADRKGDVGSVEYLEAMETFVTLRGEYVKELVEADLRENFCAVNNRPESPLKI